MSEMSINFALPESSRSNESIAMSFSLATGVPAEATRCVRTDSCTIFTGSCPLRSCQAAIGNLLSMSMKAPSGKVPLKVRWTGSRIQLPNAEQPKQPEQPGGYVLHQPPDKDDLRRESYYVDKLRVAQHCLTPVLRDIIEKGGEGAGEETARLGDARSRLRTQAIVSSKLLDEVDAALACKPTINPNTAKEKVTIDLSQPGVETRTVVSGPDTFRVQRRLVEHSTLEFDDEASSRFDRCYPMRLFNFEQECMKPSATLQRLLSKEYEKVLCNMDFDPPGAADFVDGTEGSSPRNGIPGNKMTSGRDVPKMAPTASNNEASLRRFQDYHKTVVHQMMQLSDTMGEATENWGRNTTIAPALDIPPPPPYPQATLNVGHRQVTRRDAATSTFSPVPTAIAPAHDIPPPPACPRATLNVGHRQVTRKDAATSTFSPVPTALANNNSPVDGQRKDRCVKAMPISCNETLSTPAAAVTKRRESLTDSISEAREKIIDCLGLMIQARDSILMGARVDEGASEPAARQRGLMIDETEQTSTDGGECDEKEPHEENRDWESKKAARKAMRHDRRTSRLALEEDLLVDETSCGAQDEAESDASCLSSIYKNESYKHRRHKSQRKEHRKRDRKRVTLPAKGEIREGRSSREERKRSRLCSDSARRGRSDGWDRTTDDDSARDPPARGRVHSNGGNGRTRKEILDSRNERLMKTKETVAPALSHSTLSSEKGKSSDVSISSRKSSVASGESKVPAVASFRDTFNQIYRKLSSQESDLHGGAAWAAEGSRTVNRTTTRDARKSVSDVRGRITVTEMTDLQRFNLLRAEVALASEKSPTNCHKRPDDESMATKRDVPDVVEERGRLESSSKGDDARYKAKPSLTVQEETRKQTDGKKKPSGASEGAFGSGGGIARTRGVGGAGISSQSGWKSVVKEGMGNSLAGISKCDERSGTVTKRRTKSASSETIRRSGSNEGNELNDSAPDSDTAEKLSYFICENNIVAPSSSKHKQLEFAAKVCKKLRTYGVEFDKKAASETPRHHSSERSKLETLKASNTNRGRARPGIERTTVEPKTRHAPSRKASHHAKCDPIENSQAPLDVTHYRTLAVSPSSYVIISRSRPFDNIFHTGSPSAKNVATKKSQLDAPPDDTYVPTVIPSPRPHKDGDGRDTHETILLTRDGSGPKVTPNGGDAIDLRSKRSSDDAGQGRLERSRPQHMDIAANFSMTKKIVDSVLSKTATKTTKQCRNFVTRTIAEKPGHVSDDDQWAASVTDDLPEAGRFPRPQPFRADRYPRLQYVREEEKRSRSRRSVVRDLARRLERIRGLEDSARTAARNVRQSEFRRTEHRVGVKVVSDHLLPLAGGGIVPGGWGGRQKLSHRGGKRRRKGKSARMSDNEVTIMRTVFESDEETEEGCWAGETRVRQETLQMTSSNNTAVVYADGVRGGENNVVGSAAKADGNSVANFGSGARLRAEESASKALDVCRSEATTSRGPTKEDHSIAVVVDEPNRPTEADVRRTSMVNLLNGCAAAVRGSPSPSATYTPVRAEHGEEWLVAQRIDQRVMRVVSSSEESLLREVQEINSFMRARWLQNKW